MQTPLALGLGPTGIKATGGTITTPGDGYRYHTFTSDGNFIVTAGGGKEISFVVVAGGGAGGKGANGSPGNCGGGGGAGEGRAGVFSAELTTYTCVVGAGGAAGISPTSGSDSTVGGGATSITAKGGGQVGVHGADGSDGGSGGGAGGGTPAAVQLQRGPAALATEMSVVQQRLQVAAAAVVLAVLVPIPHRQLEALGAPALTAHRSDSELSLSAVKAAAV